VERKEAPRLDTIAGAESVPVAACEGATEHDAVGSPEGSVTDGASIVFGVESSKVVDIITCNTKAKSHKRV
jgi:hypothetical protein